MNATQEFYSHEPDSQIMVKKDRAEIVNWTDNLEYINEELEYLIDIEDGMLNNAILYEQLHNLRRQNQFRLGALYRYEGTIRNAIECDTTDCDAFYLHKHEKNRNDYTAHIEKYREVKKKILSKILLHAKR